MKKLLFGLVFLNLFITNFASDKGEVAVMQVSGEILEPLTIRSNGDLDFGNILPGIPILDLKSSFSIKGEKNAKIIIKGSGKYGSDSYRLDLTNERGSKMPFLYYYSINGVINPSEKGIPINLGNNGDLNVGITAGVRPDKNQDRGVYRGVLTLSARYD